MFFWNWPITSRNFLILMCISYCIIDFTFITILLSNMCLTENKDDRIGWNFEAFFNVFAGQYGLTSEMYAEVLQKDNMINEYRKKTDLEDAVNVIKKSNNSQEYNIEDEAEDLYISSGDSSYADEVHELLLDEWLHDYYIDIPDQDWDDYYINNMAYVINNIQETDNTKILNYITKQHLTQK